MNTVVKDAAAASPIQEVTPETCCEVCSEKVFKYRCPACNKRSCSLQCSTKHKADSGCLGQRSKTHYIKLKEYTPNDMTSDYLLLEDIYRTADNATRDNERLTAQSAAPAGSQLRPPRPSPKHQILVRQCRAREIDLRLMPAGMKRHDQNRSSFVYKSKAIAWTVELDFAEARVTRLDHRLREATTLRKIIGAHLDEKFGTAVLRLEIEGYCKAGLEALKVYLRREGTPANKPTYVRLDLDQTLASAIRQETIVEYPTIVVLTHPPVPTIAIVEPPKFAPVTQSQGFQVDGKATTGVNTEDADPVDIPQENEMEDYEMEDGQIEEQNGASASGD
ncbi:hypothetical protein HKX48_008886 [Thoreauomyces humboldtii]|nr:hypothetical protein HKX48_008886 [Thoreauomyces humboldtii]